MFIRAILFGITIIAGITFSSLAKADQARTTAAVNMRTCGSVSCPVILTIPARATVWVYYCNRWCNVSYAGRRGFIYGRYLGYSGYSLRGGPIYRPPYYGWSFWWGWGPVYRPPHYRRPPVYRAVPHYRQRSSYRPRHHYR